MPEPTASLLTIGLMVGLAMQTVEAVPLTFEQRWAPVQQNIPPMRLKEQDLLDHVKRRTSEPIEQIKVRTIPIRVDPPPVTEMKEGKGGPEKGPQGDAAKEDVPLPQPRPKVRLIRKASLDICQRHGMHKVNYGRTWRCRK